MLATDGMIHPLDMPVLERHPQTTPVFALPAELIGLSP